MRGQRANPTWIQHNANPATEDKILDVPAAPGGPLVAG